MPLAPGASLGFESIDRGITLDESGSRTIQLTCLPAVTGALSFGSPAGGADGDTALYVRALDAPAKGRCPRQICFFRFSTMLNHFMFDDEGGTPVALDPAGENFIHISENKGGTATLSRVSFSDFSVAESAAILPAPYEIADCGACADEKYFYFFAVSNGAFHLCAVPLSGGDARTLAAVGGTPRSVSVTRHGVYYAAQPEVPAGLDIFQRGKHRTELYFYSFAKSAAEIVQTPPLYGAAACAGGVLAAPLMDGGLYFPFIREAYAEGYVIDRVSLSHDGRFFVFTAQNDGFIYAGSSATGRVRALNRFDNAPGLGWHNSPNCVFTGDRQWVVFGSPRTGVPQAYAAYVPKGFLEGLE